MQNEYHYSQDEPRSSQNEFRYSQDEYHSPQDEYHRSKEKISDPKVNNITVKHDHSLKAKLAQLPYEKPRFFLFFNSRRVYLTSRCNSRKGDLVVQYGANHQKWRGNPRQRSPLHYQYNTKALEVNRSDKNNSKKSSDIWQKGVTEADTKAESDTKAEATKLDSFAKEKIKDYDHLSKANKLMVRDVIRGALNKGLSEADALTYARVSARTGLDISYFCA